VIVLSDTPKQDILTFVKQWMQLLADTHLQQACALLDMPNDDDMMWTPELLRHVIVTTFDPQSRFYDIHPEGPIVTDPEQLPEQCSHALVALVNSEGYQFDYDLPLNGAWSDLTAPFIFYKHGQGYVVVLHDLHVL